MHANILLDLDLNFVKLIFLGKILIFSLIKPTQTNLIEVTLHNMMKMGNFSTGK